MKLNEHNTIKLCLILFLVLFLSIYFIETNYELEVIQISNITNQDIEKTVKVEGKIIRQKNFNTTTFIEIKDNTSTIKGIIFDKVKLNNTLEYEIIGKVTMYKNELELKLTRTISLRGSVKTIFKAFEFDRAQDNVRYTIGFSWFL